MSATAGDICYGLSREDTPIANNSAPPISAPSTTGQDGGANVTPGEQQNAPKPGTHPHDSIPAPLSTLLH